MAGKPAEVTAHSGLGNPLDAVVTQWMYLANGPITGTAKFPQGTSITATNGQTGQTINLPHGTFSFASLGVAAPSNPSSGNHRIRCDGDARSCRATINLAGITRRTITIDLPATGMKLKSIAVTPKSARDRYRLHARHYARAGRRSIFTIEVAPGDRGSTMTLTFARLSLR